MVIPYTGSTYDKIFDLTMTEDGQLNFEFSGEGLGVAVGTGAEVIIMF
jgi:hypothetical protein